MNKKKIAFVIPSLKAGGMERVISELANFASAKENIECYVIHLVQNESFYSLSKNIIEIKPHFKFNKKHRLISTFRTIQFLRSQLKKIKPIAVLSFGETYNSFTLLSALGLGINVFVSDRSRPDKDWGIFHNNLRKIIYPKAKGIIAQTSYAKNFIEKEVGHKNIMLIPNPVDIGRFKSKDNYRNRDNIILNVGRLIDSKRIDILIELFYKTDNNDWQLWIAGDGPERENLENQVENLNLTDKVVFLGNVKKVHDLYLQAKIFAFTSHSEGFPNAILEAMASGLPIIAIDCIAGPSDLVKNKVNGFLIRMNQKEEYIKCLNNMMKDADLTSRFSHNSLTIAKEYDINSIGRKYLNFILS